jgi:hypothetical protein
LAAGGITVIESAGIHGSLTVDPYAAELARKFSPFLLDRAAVAAGEMAVLA